VTLLTRSSRLLATFPAEVGAEAEKWLREKNVNIMYNTIYSPSLHKGYDMVITTTG